MSVKQARRYVLDKGGRLTKAEWQALFAALEAAREGRNAR